MRNTIEDKDKLADKLSEDDKSTIQDAITEAEDWLNSNEDADKEGIDEQMKELQSVCDPIIATIYNSQGSQGFDGDDDEEFEDL
jgi:heat shock protein 5